MFHVRNYDRNDPENAKRAWQASVTAEDGSWVLFVPTKEAAANGLKPVLQIVEVPRG